MIESSRRSFLSRSIFGSMAVTSSLAAANRAHARSAANQAQAKIERYLSSLARDDGGYAWDDQQRSHLTTTFAVVGAARVLDIELPRKKVLAEFIRSHHPSALKSLEQEHRLFTYQQIQALRWLGEDASQFSESVLAWKKPLAYLKQYEQHGYPVFMQEVSAIISRQLLNISIDQLPRDYSDYLARHRRDSGSFNNTPAHDGSDGNILNTWWGVQALHCLDRQQELADQTIEWLQSCQRPAGGFTHQPAAQLGAVDDVAYTWAATRALQLLNSEPKQRQAAVQYLLSLWNDDGGFGDRPGWSSNAVATYYALDALQSLNAVSALGDAALQPERSFPRETVIAKNKSLPDGLKVYSIQLEAHGQGSPWDAVLLAKSLKIHLWGAKNAKPGWIEQAQTLAKREHVPVQFFRSNEEYGSWLHVDGMGSYSHMSDVIAPTDSEIGASLAGQGVVAWNEYKQRRLDALHAGRGRLVWQFGENEPLVRMLLDESLERGGFAAISTFHFGNPDFTNSEPFLMRYRGHLPLVALQDAHGTEPWWFADMTEGFRTLFLATEPTWSGFLNALEQNWIVAVRHDALTHEETWMHAGSDRVTNFVKQHSSQWQWWDNPSIARPAASIAILSSADSSEAGKPETHDDRSLHVRLRCAWRNTPQGLAKQPLFELEKLTIDGTELSTELKSKRRPNGLIEDHYHLARLAQPTSGKHQVQATLRRMSDQKTLTIVQPFTQP